MLFETFLGELKAVEELAGGAGFDARVGEPVENGVEGGVDVGRAVEWRQLERRAGGGFSRRDVDADPRGSNKRASRA